MSFGSRDLMPLIYQQNKTCNIRNAEFTMENILAKGGKTEVKYEPGF
jgi:hypothetical protein